jgi:hypothetical protein
MPPRRSNNSGLATGALGAVAGSAVAGGVAGAGGTTVTTCPPGDESFYCKFVKGFSIFQMILFIIGVLVVIWIVYKMFFTGGGKRGR